MIPVVTRPRRVWTCDGCGKQDTWRKGWFHATVPIESLANPGYPLVWCSDACEDKALEKAMTS